MSPLHVWLIIAALGVILYMAPVFFKKVEGFANTDKNATISKEDAIKLRTYWNSVVDGTEKNTAIPTDVRTSLATQLRQGLTALNEFIDGKSNEKITYETYDKFMNDTAIKQAAGLLPMPTGNPATTGTSPAAPQAPVSTTMSKMPPTPVQAVKPAPIPPLPTAAPTKQTTTPSMANMPPDVNMDLLKELASLKTPKFDDNEAAIIAAMTAKPTASQTPVVARTTTTTSSGTIKVPSESTTTKSQPSTAAQAPLQSPGLVQGQMFKPSPSAPVNIVTPVVKISSSSQADAPKTALAPRMTTANPLPPTLPPACPYCHSSRPCDRPCKQCCPRARRTTSECPRCHQSRPCGCTRACAPKPKPSPRCPKCPDMSQYIRKDSIPCWNCTLD
jgi:hypothetical protein